MIASVRNHNFYGQDQVIFIDKGEDAKVSIRAIRRTAKDALDKLSKDGDVGEDDAHRAEGELDKTTAKYVAAIDDLVKVKEVELLEV